ncbi:hypothetical protein [Candidatus Borrarchaeum sp.]|uniref:hypothetical protein n=1 Tax=Candidatus Borrarchaeum sp. TaxID=2846742 RepID=UPI00257F91DC|nr:hypothetical protein [Candidatus Borrarchaeum sp.]
MISQIQYLKKMIYDAYPNLSGLVKVYVEGLEKMIVLFTNTVEEIIQRQCKQIYLHLKPEPENEQQELVKQRILNISQGRRPQKILNEHSTDLLSEEEATKIMLDFEKETFYKVEKGEKITLDDYINFAKKYGYSIVKVLVASSWLDEYLSYTAIEARNIAFENITIA